jgi:Ala-tRNA(Pro) deacylase
MAPACVRAFADDGLDDGGKDGDCDSAQGLSREPWRHLRRGDPSAGDVDGRDRPARRLPAVCIAKAVVLEDRQGYLLAAVPAANKVAFRELEEALSRRLALATEAEIASLFRDCDIGAVPPVGAAYGMDVVVDDVLCDQSEVYFEGGDHESLVHVSGAEFGRLMGRAHHARISWPKA